jgi:hypothetical protein
MHPRFKTACLLLPVIISFLLIAAHFLRANNIILSTLSLLLLLVTLFVRKPLLAKIAQGVLVLGGMEWIRTGFVLAALRIQENRPWTRLGIIIGGVACFTLASALVFFTDTLKKRYGNLRG